MLNLSEVRVAYVAHPISNASSLEMANKASQSYGSAVQAISSNTPIQMPDWVSNASQGCAS